MTNPRDQLPQHVAIIMDGNGRWAQQRQLPRIAGHEEGVKTVEKIIKQAMQSQIKILTLFAFGIENWGRPQEEVDFLMQLFVKNLETQAEHFIKNNIQLRVIGDASRIADQLQKKIKTIEATTSRNDGLILVIAFNYSGRWDILQASKKLALKVQQQHMQAEEINYENFAAELCLADLPEPDLFIRTSGEQRISNFLLWQLAYTELYFSEVLWPDFAEVDFEEALHRYSLRQRRYGVLPQENDLGLQKSSLPQGEEIIRNFRISPC